LEKVLDEPCSQMPGPPSIPDHTLVQRIGTGAYGDVWLARSALGFLRAVKVVYRDRFDEERPFQREFHGILKYEPISRTHEGLVAILHVGRNDLGSYFYYVMELADPVLAKTRLNSAARPNVENLKEFHSYPAASAEKSFYAPRTLRAELASRQRLCPLDAAKLTLQLANALQHLHSHGLVHRDIKPSNVIFVEGRPKLADIGLVTAAGDSRSFVGTEGFIPPEGPGSAGADLYGLGKLLYELAAGRDRMDFPQLPPGLNQQSDGEALLELNEVITRACAPDAQKRYATAEELAADLRLFLAGHSLRDSRRRERHLFWLKLFAVAASLLILLAGMAVWLAQRAERQASLREQQSRQRAEAESTLRRRAETAEQEAQHELYVSLVEQARTVVRSGEMGHRVHALEAIRRAVGISNSVELRREALSALALPDLRFERDLPLAPGVTFVELDPHFERVALCRGVGPVEIRSVSDNRLLNELPASTKHITYFGRWSGDSRFLAIKRNRNDSAERADIEVWEVATTRQVLLLTNTFGAFAFDRHRPRFTAGLGRATMATWDLESGRCLDQLKLDRDPIELSIAPDGQRFAQIVREPSGWIVSVYLLANGQQLVAHQFAKQIAYVDWDPTGTWLSAPDHGGAINLLNSRTGEARVLGRHQAQAVWTAFSPEGHYLLSGGWERELICWDMRIMERSFTIGLNSFIAQFRNDGYECAIINDNGIRLCAFELPSCRREFWEDLGGRLHQAAFSSDDRWFAAAGAERLGLWDLSANAPGVLSAEGADARIYFSEDKHELFVSRDEHCSRWRISAGINPQDPPRLERMPLETPQPVTSLAVVSNLIAITTAKGSQLKRIGQETAGDTNWFATIDGVNEFSPDGHWLAIYQPFTSVLNIYELPHLLPVAALANRFNFTGFEFSPSGDEVAIASRKLIEFWSTANWQRTREIKDFRAILFTTDGAGLWLTKDFRNAGLYDASGVQPLLPLPSGMLPQALSHNGRYLALSVDGRRVQIWDLNAVHQEFQNLGIDWTTSSSVSR
jgi:WD40 repeat protein